MTPPDILIVGAGPTGLLLANLLGASGVSVLIVERHATTVQEPRAVSLDDESMRALQSIGLDAKIATSTVKGYGSIYLGPDRRPFAEVKPQARTYGFDKRNAFEQPVLENCLRDGLKRFPNVAMQFETMLTGFDQTQDSVTAELATPAGTRTLAVKYMVACDGGRSGVRKTLGISLEGSTFEEPWLIVDTYETHNRCFHTEVFCDPARSLITLPGPRGIRRYEFKLNPGETTEEAETETFARKLMAECGPDRDVPIRRKQVYTFHARVAESWRKGRVFLAGDAAHLSPPFAGQGMNSGLRDAVNLAWKLDEALRLTNPDKLLDSYEAERKPHVWEMINLALNMGRIMMPVSAFRGALTRLCFRALGLYPPARDYVAQMRFKPAPRFAHGALDPRTEDPKGVVGRMIPQPLVSDARRERVLLDAVLEDRPTVLIYDQDPSKIDPEPFRNAGAFVIGITPEWINPPNANFPIYRDASRLFSEAPFAECLGYSLLVRRDRYTAAVRPIGQSLDLLPILGRLTKS